jgi:hypothetical protein
VLYLNGCFNALHLLEKATLNQSVLKTATEKVKIQGKKDESKYSGIGYSIWIDFYQLP